MKLPSEPLSTTSTTTSPLNNNLKSKGSSYILESRTQKKKMPLLPLPPLRSPPFYAPSVPTHTHTHSQIGGLKYRLLFSPDEPPVASTPASLQQRERGSLSEKNKQKTNKPTAHRRVICPDFFNSTVCKKKKKKKKKSNFVVFNFDFF